MNLQYFTSIYFSQDTSATKVYFLSYMYVVQNNVQNN